jgi:hypothetical protein
VGGCERGRDGRDVRKDGGNEDQCREEKEEKVDSANGLPCPFSAFGSPLLEERLELLSYLAFPIHFTSPPSIALIV